jgi:arabinogalactan endo-1,4-beta-galactosidase
VTYVPRSVAHICNGWATGLGNQFRKLVLVGAAALCWTLWTSKNNMVFANSSNKTYMHVLFRGTYNWIMDIIHHVRSYFQKPW